MILITGSSSFVGENLIKKFVDEKVKFVGIDNRKANFKSKKIYKRDINDENIYKLIKKNSTIVHLAAISNVKDCEAKPMETLKANINGTINLINQGIKKKANHFIFASTEWVYPNYKKTFDENSKIKIDDLDNNYSISKIIGEKLITNYSKQIKITILRFGIIYSDRKSGGSAVESLVNSVKNNNIITIGSKETSRRFVHIEDIIEGIYLSYKKQVPGIFNLAGDKDVSLNEIINISQNILKKKVTIKENNKHNVSIRKVSNQKAKKKLGWYPKIKIKEGIKKII